MNFFYKILIKISNLIISIVPQKFKISHQYQNKNQITTMNIILATLKSRGYYPDCIFDIGCAKGEWFKKAYNLFNKSNFFLFDADDSNITHLKNLKKNFSNLNYKIAILSDRIKEVSFFKMGYGSSIYEENTDYKREKIQKNTKILHDFIPDDYKIKSNLIKLDVQGSEIDILKGCGSKINFFDAIILESSLKKYNKNSPLILDVMNYMNDQNYILYDVCDAKRLGNSKSFLLQLDLVFLKKDHVILKNINFN